MTSLIRRFYVTITSFLQVLFSCSGEDGSYLVAAQARRKLKMNNTIFCMRIPSVGVLLHPKHPDSTFFTGDDADDDADL